MNTRTSKGAGSVSNKNDKERMIRMTRMIRRVRVLTRMI